MGDPVHTDVSSVSVRPDSYRPRHPEQTVLYEVLAVHLEMFLARQQHDGHNVPRFVEQELRSFLECGVLACGFLRLHCDTCGQDKLVPFSCKGRAFCPSCCGRRMVDTAAHLVDRVFPHVPVRQWVLSLPHGLRYRLAYDAEMITAVLGVFVRAVFGFLRRRARESGIDQTQCGAVTFVQRFGGSLNTNVHFHTLALDGVYAPKPDGEPEFFPLHAPETSDVQSVAETLAKRIPALLQRREPDAWQSGVEKPDKLAEKNPWLSGVYVASVTGRIATGPSVGSRVRVSGDRVDAEELHPGAVERCARVDGFSLHANVAVPARDRARLERLVRYVARPPLASERLKKLPDGRLVYEFKRPWRDGTTRAVFEPLELIEKLAALVPTPRAHLTRYHGILAPAAAWRAAVVPQCVTTDQRRDPAATPVPAPDALAPSGCEDSLLLDDPGRHPRNYAWAELMRRVFEVDVLACDRCGGRLRLLAAIHPPEITRKILDCLGLPSRPPPLSPAIRERLDLTWS